MQHNTINERRLKVYRHDGCISQYSTLFPLNNLSINGISNIIGVVKYFNVKIDESVL